MIKAVDEQRNKEHATNNAHDKLDRKLVRGDHRARNHVAQQNKQRSKQRRIGNGSPDLVPLEHGDNVGHNQADVGNRPHRHHHRRRDGRGDSKPKEQHGVVIHPKVLRKVAPHAYNVEVVGECNGQGDQGHRQPHQLVLALDHKRKMTNKPRGERLGKLKAVGQKACNATNHVAKHNAYKRNHGRVLKGNPLDKPHKAPGSQQGDAKCKQCAAHHPQRRKKDQRKQHTKLRRRNGGARCGGHKLIHAKLLHNKAGNAHPHPRAQNCEQAGQARNNQRLYLAVVAGNNPGKAYVHHANKQGSQRRKAQNCSKSHS